MSSDSPSLDPVASSRGPNAIVHDYYHVGRRLTEDAMGAGGEVVRGRRKEDQQEFAIKVIRFSNSREDRSQIQAMTEVNHPGIIKLEDWFETKDMLFLVMEMARGGEMFGRIAERGKFTERDAANCFLQVLEAIGHMHARGMVHCDLKPENILYEDDTDKQIKIADFGFAQFIPGGQEGGQHLTRQLGTLSYTSPEILLNQGYTTKADMWSLGVILYILLSGIPPFGKRRGETDRDVRHHITHGRWRFYETHFANVSPEARDLVSKLLVVDPAQRLDFQQALEHQWIQGHAPEKPLGETFIVELGNFNNLRGMYKLSSHALAGLVSRFAQPDAIAAISADSQNIPRVLQEGSIQPIVSLAYSKADQERESACNALANLALRDEFQELIVREGGLRRLNQLALKRPVQSSNVRFFVALALARLAREPDVRLPMLNDSVNADPSTNTVRALIQLAQPPPTNPSRASRQAIEALALLALEEELHQQILMVGLPDDSVPGRVRPAVMEALLWQAAEKQPLDFQRSALLALRRICSSCVENPRLLEVLNQQLTFVWKVAQASQASGPTGEAKADSANRLSGLMSMLLVIKDDGILDDMVDKSGVQDWHSALASPSAPTTVPNIYSDEPPPELNRTVSQVRWSIADSLPRTYD
jgi:serine/threonine protein kinase